MLLHHGFGCGKIWGTVYPQLVAAGFRVVFYDRRGFGRSEGGDGFTEFYESDRYNPESVVELKAVKERLGIGRCHIVGQCEGGVVGTYYAAAYPDEVITLVAASTQCYSEVPMTQAQRREARPQLHAPRAAVAGEDDRLARKGRAGPV